MSLGRGMDKDVVHMKYFLTIKKYEIMPFTGTWMDLEIMLHILSEVKSDRE